MPLRHLILRGACQRLNSHANLSRLTTPPPYAPLRITLLGQHGGGRGVPGGLHRVRTQPPRQHLPPETTVDARGRHATHTLSVDAIGDVSSWRPLHRRRRMTRFAQRASGGSGLSHWRKSTSMRTGAGAYRICGQIRQYSRGVTMTAAPVGADALPARYIQLNRHRLLDDAICGAYALCDLIGTSGHRARIQLWISMAAY